MKRLLRFLLPILILGVAFMGARHIMANKSKAKRGPSARPNVMTVAAKRLQSGDYTVRVTSHGMVRPRTQSTLIPQVSGKIITVSPDFRDGGFFDADETLLVLDPRDYQTAVKVAQADLSRARLEQVEEQARGGQALRDWQRLGLSGKADELMLRKPQLGVAKAAVVSATARLEQAQLNLERTRITAPYAGRVLSKGVDVGQVVSPGTVLATIFAVDYVEIRLPLSNRQLEYVRIPERYRDDHKGVARDGHKGVAEVPPPVTVVAAIGRHRYRWRGRIVRAEGAIDAGSRQLFVVTQVDDPYGRGSSGNPPLKIGQFVTAEIEGITLHRVFVIPRETLYQDGQVFVVKDGRLKRQSVTVLWSDDRDAVIGQGVQEGDTLVLTAVGGSITGTRVKALIEGEEKTGIKLDSPDF